MNYDDNVMDYEAEVMKTCSASYKEIDPQLLHGIIGLATEAGEMLDAAKKSMFYGRRIDVVNLLEELGDAEWYLAVIRNALSVSQEYVQKKNIEKLRARYGETFSPEKALNRNLDKERRALEGE